MDESVMERNWNSNGNISDNLYKSRDFYCAFDETSSVTMVSKFIMIIDEATLTLNICDTLIEDLLQRLGVLQLLRDLANDAFRKLLLLSLLNLPLIPYPRV